MKISSRVLQVVDAPIDLINRERVRLEREGGPIFNLGQAIPDFPPPPIVREVALQALEDPSIHLYTPDPGLPEVREAIAGVLRDRQRIVSAQAEDIVVTAGANHAFLLLCSVLLEPGDRVGLLSPFFLNHKMAVEGCGGVAVELCPENGSYPVESVIRAIEEHDLRALVVVNPSNPTGKVFTRQELQDLLGVCLRHEVWLIADEVYNAFVYPPATMVSLASLPGAAEITFTIGSFSKEFGMTGWRLGWVLSPRSVLSQILKVQDYSIICAPRLAQVVAAAALQHAPDWAMRHLETLAARRTELLSILAGSGLFDIFEGRGAYFIWLKPRAGMDPAPGVLDIMARARVCIIPGHLFGETWRGWFRISYGSLSIDQLRIGAQRLVSYFGTPSDLFSS